MKLIRENRVTGHEATVEIAYAVAVLHADTGIPKSEIRRLLEANQQLNGDRYSFRATGVTRQNHEDYE